MTNNKQQTAMTDEKEILNNFKNSIVECLKDVTLTPSQTNHIYRCYLFALKKGFISCTVDLLPSSIFYRNVLRGLTHAKIGIDVHEKMLALYEQTQKIELDYFKQAEVKSTKKDTYINTMFYASN
jgi:hypothetical protein